MKAKRTAWEVCCKVYTTEGRKEKHENECYGSELCPHPKFRCRSMNSSVTVFEDKWNLGLYFCGTGI
jgi:hypothetical protein